MKNKLLLLSLLGAFIILPACNTVSGAGEDIEAGGEAIEGTAEKYKSY